MSVESDAPASQVGKGELSQSIPWLARGGLGVPRALTYLCAGSVPLDAAYRLVTASRRVSVRPDTTVVALSSTALCLALGLTGAYSLSRFSYRGRSMISVSLLFMQLLPAVLLAIPLFLVLNRLGLANSLTGLVLAYATINLPFSVWILKGYLKDIPVEVEEAARIDGCTHFGTLFRIVLPTVAPALVAVATLVFVNAWNEYLLALVLVNEPSKQVLGVGLTSYVSQFSTDLPGLFAMSTLTTLPVVLLFVLLQRRLIGGLSAGAVK